MSRGYYHDHVISVSKPSQIPEVEHFAIIEGTEHYTPGDQRSIDCPGHGYGPSTEYFIQYSAIKGGEKELLEELEYLEKNNNGYNRKEYRVFKVTPMVVQKKLQISINPGK